MNQYMVIVVSMFAQLPNFQSIFENKEVQISYMLIVGGRNETNFTMKVNKKLNLRQILAAGGMGPIREAKTISYKSSPRS